MLRIILLITLTFPALLPGQAVVSGDTLPEFRRQMAEAAHIHTAMTNDLERAAREIDRLGAGAVSAADSAACLSRAERWVKGAHKLAVELLMHTEMAGAALGESGLGCFLLDDAWSAVRTQDELILKRLSRILKLLEDGNVTVVPLALRAVGECRAKRAEKAEAVEGAVWECLR